MGPTPLPVVRLRHLCPTQAWWKVGILVGAKPTIRRDVSTKHASGKSEVRVTSLVFPMYQNAAYVLEVYEHSVNFETCHTQPPKPSLEASSGPLIRRRPSSKLSLEDTMEYSLSDSYLSDSMDDLTLEPEPKFEEGIYPY